MSALEPSKGCAADDRWHRPRQGEKAEDTEQAGGALTRDERLERIMNRNNRSRPTTTVAKGG